MTVVLGLHLGHDASACVVADGEILSFIERERHDRVKHAGFMSIETIHLALDDAGVAVSEIDFVAISQTQNWPLVLSDVRRFSFEIAEVPHPALHFPENRREGLAMYRSAFLGSRDMARLRLQTLFLEVKRAGGRNGYADAMVDEFDLESPHFRAYQNYEFPIWPAVFERHRALGEIAKIPDNTLREAMTLHAGGNGAITPVDVVLEGRAVPGALFPHHYAHAGVAHYFSDVETTAITTADNGVLREAHGYIGGLFCVGRGDKVDILWPNYSVLGNVYNKTAVHIGFDTFGGAGKMMGLAPYGSAELADVRFAGNVFDHGAMFNADNQSRGRHAVNWVGRMAGAAAKRGYVSVEPDPTNVLNRYSLALAAGTQRLFEAQALVNARVLKQLTDRLGLQPEALLVSGGCGLNCPANTRLHDEGPFPTVFVPPSCDDSGLALGAALLMMHSILGVPRRRWGRDHSASAYLGRRWSRSDIVATVDRLAGMARVSEPLSAAEEAASDLADDKVVAWYEGRSEIGPRALGHRSILADPRHRANWSRVNRIKSREQWRPFAPAVLEEEAGRWFSGGPGISPFMLFTAEVKSRDLPAITHVDGSARVQTVSSRSGRFRDLIAAFGDKTGVPVVLNTSFNGPGEPIVESPDEAADLFLRTDIDVLYLEGHRIERRTTGR